MALFPLGPIPDPPGPPDDRRGLHSRHGFLGSRYTAADIADAFERGVECGRLERDDGKIGE